MGGGGSGGRSEEAEVVDESMKFPSKATCMIT